MFECLGNFFKNYLLLEKYNSETLVNSNFWIRYFYNETFSVIE